MQLKENADQSYLEEPQVKMWLEYQTDLWTLYLPHVQKVRNSFDSQNQRYGYHDEDDRTQNKPNIQAVSTSTSVHVIASLVTVAANETHVAMVRNPVAPPAPWPLALKWLKKDKP